MWNEVVKPDDTVYHIGDFAFGDKNNIPSIVSRLNGQKILVLGNHDYHRSGNVLKQITSAGFAAMYNELYAEIDGHKVYFRHIPNMEFKPNESATYHICGHVHTEFNKVGNILNAGVDVCGYIPQSIDWLIQQPEVRGDPHRGYIKKEEGPHE
jgi:calcineurin-like phosphoesterase family protein